MSGFDISCIEPLCAVAIKLIIRTHYEFSSTSSGSCLTSSFDIRCTECLSAIAINLVTLTVMKFMELAADYVSYHVSVIVVI
jgi:hypothetical protein